MKKLYFLGYEEKVLSKLITDDMEYKDKARLKFGFYLFLDSIKKGVIIYSLATYFGLFLETFLMHSSFLFVRQVSYGWHSSSHVGCILSSVVCFTCIPIFLDYLGINNSIFYLIAVIIIFSVLIYIGPVETKISKLSKKKTIVLHKKLRRRLLLLAILCLFIPITYYQYIITGVGLQLITLIIQCVKNRR